MKKTVLVTGATGAIGKEVIKHLVALNNYQVYALVRSSKQVKSRIGKYAHKINLIYGDITKPKSLDKIPAGMDHVIHLAALIPPVADKKPELAQQINVRGTSNLIEHLEKKSPHAFFQFSSSISVYGDRIENPNIKVDDELKSSDYDEYGQSKIDTEKLIQKSKLKWVIYRLSGILDPELNAPDPLMFHMPLNTHFEMCTTRDCGRAFVNALEKADLLSGRVFNLAGGETCRATFDEFLSSAFQVSGLGKLDFPKQAFAEKNFHCGYYVDGAELEHILHFQQDSKEDYFNLMKQALPKWQILAAKLFAPIIKWFMLQSSDPWKAWKKKDPEGMKRFFH